jgi:hypothetical protein
MRFTQRNQQGSMRNTLQGAFLLTDLLTTAKKLSPMTLPEPFVREPMVWTTQPRDVRLTDVRKSVPGGGVPESTRDKYEGKNVRAGIVDAEMRRVADIASESTAAAASLWAKVRVAQGLPAPGPNTVPRSDFRKHGAPYAHFKKK